MQDLFAIDSESKEITIVGAGVIGLTTAVHLLRSGRTVRLISTDFSPDTTSDAAGAVWYPYAAQPMDQILKWSAVSYQEFSKLSISRPTLIQLVKFVELFDRLVGDAWWVSALKGTEASIRHARNDEIPDGYQDGYVAMVPVINVPLYMPYLLETIRELGGKIIQVEAPIADLRDVEARVIVNCTGLGSAELCNDSDLFPIAGQVVRTENPGIEVTYADDEGPNALSYIIPRPFDCIVGGTAISNDHTTRVDGGVTDDIIRRATALDPRLGEAKILDAKVGFRPGRSSVRLERDADATDRILIHNYGHGGSGYTVSWGCAYEVERLLRDHF